MLKIKKNILKRILILKILKKIYYLLEGSCGDSYFKQKTDTCIWAFKENCNYEHRTGY